MDEERRCLPSGQMVSSEVDVERGFSSVFCSAGCRISSAESSFLTDLDELSGSSVDSARTSVRKPDGLYY